MKLENLIVSCQALPGDELYGGDAIIKMARAVIKAGANAIRTNDGKNVSTLKSEFDLPVIGLIKKDYKGYDVFITPTIKEIDELAKAGADWIAIDATKSSRPISIKELFDYSRKAYPNVKLMADISTYGEAKAAYNLGFDAISTTLVGYTKHTKDSKQPDFDLLEKIIKDFDITIIAEGNFNTPELARKAMDMGANAVVVGSAITRPQYITKVFLDKLKD